MNDLSLALDKTMIFSEYTELSSEHKSVNLSQGIPEDFYSQHADDICKKSIKSWQYVDTRGNQDLREVVVENIYNQKIKSENIIVTSGCTESIFISMLICKRICEKGVVIVQPFYPYYQTIADILAINCFYISLKEDKSHRYKLDVDGLELLFKKGVKTLILNIPNNPNGWVPSDEETRKIRKLIDQYGVFLILDEAYKHFVYQEDLAKSTDILIYENGNLFICGSCSKYLSMPGLRIGWLYITNSTYLKDAISCHMNMTYCQPPILQKIAEILIPIAAKNHAKKLGHYVNKRRKLSGILDSLNIGHILPDGGHYIVGKIGSDSPVRSANEFARYLTKEKGVTPLPLDPFYAEGETIPYVRFSFSTTMENLYKAENAVNA